MLLKQSPQDFIVDEQMNLPRALDHGSHIICKITKIDRNTRDVCNDIAKQLHVSSKAIGFAGLKDKHAITTQYISIRGKQKSDIAQLSCKNTTIEFVQYSSQPISIGALQGNTFKITARDLTQALHPVQHVINYFGQQRFAHNNHVVGEFIVKQDYEKAVQAICEQQQGEVKEYFATNPTDPIGALRKLSKPELLFYLSAYQSLLWNRCASKYVEQYAHTTVKFPFGVYAIPTNLQLYTQDALPLAGFMTTQQFAHKEVVDEVLAEEGLTYRSFINRAFPEASAHGDWRDVFIGVKDCVVSAYDEGVQTVSFSLPKGAYATVVMHTMHALTLRQGQQK